MSRPKPYCPFPQPQSTPQQQQSSQSPVSRNGGNIGPKPSNKISMQKNNNQSQAQKSNRHSKMSSEALRDHPEILFSQVLKRTYQIQKLLGKGTFSVIYQCLNLQTREKLAIKIGCSEQGSKMLNLEKKIYRIVNGLYGGGDREGTSDRDKDRDRDKMEVSVGGFARYYQFGRTQRFSYIVLEKLSQSIQDIFYKLQHKFSIKTVLNIGLQGVQIIQRLHKIGFLHRDIKPANFLLGHGNKKDKIYLVDFGLSRRYLLKKFDANNPSSQDNRIIPEKTGKSFVGTKRFASVAAHFGRQQSKKDDLQALGYTLIYFLKGRLPWQGLKFSSKLQQYQTIGKIKKQICVEQLCRFQCKDMVTYQGEPFLKMFRYLNVLNYGDTPNYQFLKKLFIDQIKVIDQKPNNIQGYDRWKCRYKFDWMEAQEGRRDHRDKNQRGERERERERYRGRERDRDRERRHSHYQSRDRRDRDREEERDYERERRRASYSSKSTQKQRYMK